VTLRKRYSTPFSNLMATRMCKSSSDRKGSDSEESDEDDGPKYPDAGGLIFQQFVVLEDLVLCVLLAMKNKKRKEWLSGPTKCSRVRTSPTIQPILRTFFFCLIILAFSLWKTMTAHYTIRVLSAVPKAQWQQSNTQF